MFLLLAVYRIVSVSVAGKCTDLLGFETPLYAGKPSIGDPSLASSCSLQASLFLLPR